METKVSSEKKEVIISYDRPTVIIGERINPTGRKKFTQALLEGDLSLVERDARQQVEAGAVILDCNVSAQGIDDVKMLPEAVKVIMNAVDAPICIDSSNPDAMEAALKVYKGKALINSVSGETRSLERMLPLVKEYGTAVIGMVQDDEGIPKDAEKRVAVAYKICEAADKIGIPREDIVIDVMAYAIGAEARSGRNVLDAMHQIRQELGVNMTMGTSNISFGMPDRALLNTTWIAMSIEAGGTALIANASQVMPSVLAADLVLGRDRFARRYIESHRKRQAAAGGQG
jgi:5-methyltetrahydrofolate--homocysteine methyltransferase